MNTTCDFLDALKARHNLASDYAVAKFLRVSTAQTSRWRHGQDFFGDTTAFHVAELLELDPAYVMACAHAERSSSVQIRRVWERVTEQFAKAACLALLAIAPLSAPSPAHASGIDNPLSVLCKRRKRAARKSSERLKGVRKLTLSGLLP